MSKCVKCGNEILTGDIHWEMGLCNNCYNELYKDHKTHISLDKMWLKLAQDFRDENEKLQDKVADLEAKLVESEEQLKEELVEKKGLERALSACNRQNDEFADMIKKLVNEKEELKQQLAEKDEEIAYLTKQVKKFNNEAQKYFEDAYCNDFHNQDKISFAVEVLKIAQDYVQQYVNNFDDMHDCLCAIDNQIKRLTHQHENKGE